MCGLLATIIAAVKGHTTYAWVTGIWTAIAVVVAISGYPEIAIAPGFLFLAIAISMENLRKQKKNENREDSVSDQEPALIEETSKAIETADTSDDIIMSFDEEGEEKAVVDEEQNYIQDEQGIIDIQSETGDSEEASASAVNDSMPIKYCRKCGKELLEGAVFCRECGTKVQRFIYNENADLPESVEISDNNKSVPQLDLSILPPVLRRAHIFTEDEEWDKANEYFERVLDADPENAYAYIGKALVDIKVKTVDELTDSEIASVCKTNNFKRALMYADRDVKALLTHWQELAAKIE